MNAAKRLERRALQEAERALHVARLQAETIRTRSVKVATDLKGEAWTIARRIVTEVRALAADETTALLEETRAEREALVSEERARAADYQAQADELALTLLADARNEAHALLAEAETRATAILAEARSEEARIRDETEAAVGRLHAEADLAAVQIRDAAIAESESIRRVAQYEAERSRVEGVQSPAAGNRRRGRMRRIVVAGAVLVGMSAAIGGVWAAAGSDDRDSARTSPASAETTGVSSSVPDTEGTAASSATRPRSAPTAVVGGAEVTRAPRFDTSAFLAQWRSQTASLAPAGFVALQQRDLRKPVTEGVAHDPDGLIDALSANWISGYGVFFGSGSGGTSALSSATATVSQYATTDAASSAFRSARRSYVDDRADGVSELGAKIIDAHGAPIFGSRYVDGAESVTTAYVAFADSLVQISVAGPVEESLAALRGMLGTVTQWAEAAGLV